MGDQQQREPRWLLWVQNWSFGLHPQKLDTMFLVFPNSNEGKSVQLSLCLKGGISKEPNNFKPHNLLFQTWSNQQILFYLEPGKTPKNLYKIGWEWRAWETEKRLRYPSEMGQVQASSQFTELAMFWNQWDLQALGLDMEGLETGIRRNYLIKSSMASSWWIPRKWMQRNKLFRGHTLTISSLTCLVLEIAV